MPRRPKRNLPTEESPALYRFIRTDLTEDNWHDLVQEAAMSPAPSAHPSPKQARIVGGGRLAVAWDIIDLASARAVQERFRVELKAIRAGETSPAHTSTSRLLESNFQALKEILVTNPTYVKEHQYPGGMIGHEVLGPVFVEWQMEERVCEGGCQSTFTVRSSSRKRTCGDDNCRVAASNARRKQKRPQTP